MQVVTSELGLLPQEWCENSGLPNEDHGTMGSVAYQLYVQTPREQLAAVAATQVNYHTYK